MPSSGIAGPIATPGLGFNVLVSIWSKILLIVVKTGLFWTVARSSVVLPWTMSGPRRSLVILYLRVGTGACVIIHSQK